LLTGSSRALCHFSFVIGHLSLVIFCQVFLCKDGKAETKHSAEVSIK